MTDDDDVRRIVEGAASDPSPAQRARMRAELQAALEGDVRPAAGSPNRWLRWTVAAAVAAALIVGVVIVRSRSDTEELTPATEPTPTATVVEPSTTTAITAPTTTPTTTTRATTTRAPTTTTTTAEPPSPAPSLMVPSGLRVESLAQPAPHEAWAIAADAVNGRPATLLRSSDDGQTWRAVMLPDTLADPGTVVFADAMNGWTLGTNALVATHDGGATWTSVPIVASGEAPAAVTSSGGFVDVFAFDDAATTPAFQIFTSPVDTDTFEPSGLTMQPGAGPALDVSVASSPSRAWLVYNDRQLIDAARSDAGSWESWTTPCSVGGADGATPADAGAVAASADGSLVVVCTTSPFASPPSTIGVFTSTDGGTTFRPAALLPDSEQTMTDGTQSPAQLSIVLAPSAKVILVGYAATDGTSRLAISTDGGATWGQPPSIVEPGDQLADGFVLSDGGVLITTQSQRAYLTHDNGTTWTDVGGGVVVQ